MARTRTFIAIALDDAVRARLVALQEELAQAAPDVKWTEPENLHVTLLFLGEVDDRDLPGVCRAAQAAVRATPAFSVTVEGAGCFPNPRRPRVLWVGLGPGQENVVAIHDALEAPLLDLGCYRREERQYTPHITLGRVKGERANDQLAPTLATHRAWSAGEQPVSEIHVMGSHLTPHGPEYTVIGRAKLA
jgi:2'-5' RNA ligase